MSEVGPKSWLGPHTRRGAGIQGPTVGPGPCRGLRANQRCPCPRRLLYEAALQPLEFCSRRRWHGGICSAQEATETRWLYFVFKRPLTVGILGTFTIIMAILSLVSGDTVWEHAGSHLRRRILEGLIGACFVVKK